MEVGSPLLLSTMALLLATIAAAAPTPGCQSHCGAVHIPFPFGVGDDAGCYRSPSFQLTCDNATNKLFNGDFEILGIDVARGEVQATMPAGQHCYTREGKPRSSITRSSANLTGSIFTFSRRNVFTVIGCDTLVRFSDPSRNFVTGCMSLCSNASRIENNTCNGIGCCQLSVPEGLKYFVAEFLSFDNYTKIWQLNNCGYGFLVEDGVFKFNTTILTSEYDYGALRMPMVMDWIAGRKTCKVAMANTTTFACRSEHSFCVEYEFGGYRCNCSDGFVGNPYLEDGCKDINECDDPKQYPCNGICMNTPGDYNCTCKPGSHGNNPKFEQCIPDPVDNGTKLPFYVKLLIGLGAGFLFLMVVASWVYWGCQKRKLIMLKQEFFKRNGGLFLEQQISSVQSSAFRIFSVAEMKSATSNFDEGSILGKGGNGIVYKGILDDGRVVAIKRSMMIDQKKSKEFAKEMFILSQINHINIVKLLGCCLEVEVPMLVYEYVPNGTLFQLIHQKNNLQISFETRLTIAAETAEGLAYLHSAASPPILHGDVKSSNVLLDDNYHAKVSDFGTSVLAPNDKAQFTTVVQGTCGYLDPEYLQTCQLTEKSDVYSFGVVLVELLTRKKAFNFSGPEEERSLAMNFISHESGDRLMEILDPAITEDGLSKELREVSRIAVQCLGLNGDERPTMKEVLMELEALRSSDRHPWVEQYAEERERLLEEPTDSSNFDSTRCELNVQMENLALQRSGR